MDCPKCKGLCVVDWAEVLDREQHFEPVVTHGELPTYCINCGWRSLGIEEPICV